MHLYKTYMQAHLHINSTDTPTNTNTHICTDCTPISQYAFPHPLWCYSAALSWRAADGTGSLLLSFIERYLFYSFCSTDALLHMTSVTAFRWNDPIFSLPWASNTNVLEKEAWKMIPFIFSLLNFHFINTWKKSVMFVISLHRHPEVSWGVPGRGCIRRRVRFSGGRRQWSG